MPVPEAHIPIVEELHGANTQQATLETAHEKLREAVSMMLVASREKTRP